MEIYSVDDRTKDDYNQVIVMTNFPSYEEVEQLYKKNIEFRDKLKEYNDLEEQGRLLRPTVIAGDVVYCVDFANKLIDPSKILKIRYIGGFEYESDEMYFCQEDIGESVFLKKEEAEKKLEEVKESEEDK